ncbi:MAG: acyl-CoA dehydrogenase, partial [bacterium]|nr:acyl-CoA dehydrogenase [bacterium]
RLLVLSAAEKMDLEGPKGAKDFISMVKIVGPRMAEKVASRAIQVFGGMGVCQDTLLPDVFNHARFCRIADGPDEVHMSQLGKLTIRRVLSEVSNG